MENNQPGTQIEFVYDGQEVGLNDLASEIEQRQKDAQKNSRFRQIDDGKTAQLVFTGKVFKRVSAGTDDKGTAYKSDKLDWELSETVPEGGKDAGKNKLFSVGARNLVNKDIMANIKAGKLTMFVSRKGTGKSTKYEVTTPE